MSERNRVRTQMRREVKVGSLLLGNDKNNVIADVLSYFLCLSSKFEGLNNNN